MPKKKPIESELSRDSDSQGDNELRAAIQSAWELEETRGWIRERRENKNHSEPPPNARILEARIADAIKRHALRSEGEHALRNKKGSAKRTGLNLSSIPSLPPQTVQKWISKRLPNEQSTFLSDPNTDERLCDDLLDAIVAQAAGSTQGLSMPDLRARASALGWVLASPTQYADFYRTEVLPAWTHQGGEVSRCPECSESFVPRNKRRRYCSDTCSARKRNRGLQKVGKGRSAVEVASKRHEVRIRGHLANCQLCRAGEYCIAREGLLDADDALSRRNYEMSPEPAEEMRAAQGRTRKRGAS